MGQIRLFESIPTLGSTATTVTLGPAIVNVGGQQYRNFSTLTCNLGTVGAGGLDTGSLAANTLYYVHAVVSNGALALLASLSKTAPTGFTIFRYLKQGFVTNASSQVAAVVTSTTWDWMAYTPAFSAGFGSVTNVKISVRRVGPDLYMRGIAQAGTTTGAAGSISIPWAMNYSVLASSARNRIGGIQRIQNAGGTNSDALNRLFADGSDTGNVYLSSSSTGDVSGGTMSKTGVSSAISTSDYMFIDLVAPIVGWSATDF